MFTIEIAIINAITTNPDFVLPRSYCRLSTPWSLQYQGKYCSYLAKALSKLLVKVGKSKKDLDVSYLGKSVLNSQIIKTSDV